MPNSNSTSTIAQARAELQEALHLLDHPTKWQKAGPLIERAINLLEATQGDSKAILAATFLEGIGPLVPRTLKSTAGNGERGIIDSSKQSIGWAIDALISENQRP